MAKKKVNKGGRPERIFTEEEVQMMKKFASVGVSMKQIAAAFSCAEETLRTKYGTVLEECRAQAEGLMAGHVFRKALEGSDTLAIFWLKTRGGWRETGILEETTVETGAISDKPLSIEEWNKKYALPEVKDTE